MDDRHYERRNSNEPPAENGRDPYAPEALDQGSGPGDELLSAYLDGECTAAEQAEIEARMAASGELRQLVEELRGVRTSLDLLPQHRLEADFAERVLQRAEREILSGGFVARDAAADSAAVARGVSPQPEMIRPSHRDRLGAARPFLWTLAALAAAVVILITNREPEMRPDPIAKGPDAKVAANGDRRAAQSERIGSTTLGEASARKIERTTSDDALSAEGVESDFVTWRAKDPQQGAIPNFADDESALAENEARQKSDAPPKPDLAKRLNQVPAGPDSNVDAGTSDAERYKKQFSPSDLASDDQVEKTRAELMKESLAAGPPEGRAPLGRAALVPLDADNDGTTAAAPAVPEAAPPADGAAADSDVAFDNESRSASAEAEGREGAKDFWGANGNAAYMFAAPRESLRVVEVLVERDAWQRGAIDDVLMRNSIALIDAPSQTPALSQSAPSAGARAVEPSAQDKLGVNRDAGERPATDGLELLVVTATAAQVEAALGDFDQQREFAVLQVTDASAPQQWFEQSHFGMQDARGLTRSADGRVLSQQTWEMPEERFKQQQQGAGDSRNVDSAEAKAARLAVDAAAKELSGKPATELKAAEGPPIAARRSVLPTKKAGEPSAPAGETDPLPARPQAATEFRPLDEAADRRDRAGSYGSARAADPQNASGGALGGIGSEESGRAFRGGFGGRVGGGGYGGVPSQDGASEVPQGYGQRVQLQRARVADVKLGKAATEQYDVRRQRAIPRQNENEQATPLAPERVLFFFRVVDAPMATSPDTTGAATATGEILRRSPQGAVQIERRDSAAPVPAPAGSSR